MIKDRYHSIFVGGSTHVGLDQKKEIANRIDGYGIALDVREASVKDYDDHFIGNFNEKWLHEWAQRLLKEYPFLKEGEYEGLLDFILLDLFQATAAKITDENKAIQMTSKEASTAEKRLQNYISENGPFGLILAWGFHINYRTFTALSQDIQQVDDIVEFIYACDKGIKNKADAGWQSWSKIVEWILESIEAKGGIENGRVTDYGQTVMREYQEIFGPLKEIKPVSAISTPVIFEGTFPFFQIRERAPYPPYYEDWGEGEEEGDYW